MQTLSKVSAFSYRGSGGPVLPDIQRAEEKVEIHIYIFGETSQISNIEYIIL